MPDPITGVRLGIDLVAARDAPALLGKVWKMSPILLGWCVVRVAWPRPPAQTTFHLTGVVLGHPVLSDLHQILTSEIEVIAVDDSWAKTQSRYYELRTRLPREMLRAYRLTEASRISELCRIPIEAVSFDTEWTGQRSADPPPISLPRRDLRSFPSRRWHPRRS